MIKKILEGGRDEKVITEGGQQVGELYMEFPICDFFKKKKEAE